MSPTTEYLGQHERDGEHLHIFKRTTEPDALTTEIVEIGMTDEQMKATAADLLSREKRPFQVWDELLVTAPHIDETTDKRITDSLTAGEPELEFAGGKTGTKEIYGRNSFSFSHSVSMIGAELGDESVYVKVTTPDNVTLESVSGGITADHPEISATDQNTRVRKVHLAFEQGHSYNITFNIDFIKKPSEEQQIVVTWFIGEEEQFSKSLTIDPVS